MKRLAVFVSLFASACIGEIGGTDTPNNDPPHDPPPPPTDVRMTVHDSAGPVAGLAVVFQNPDDSEVATLMTDAQGVATAKLPMGGSVSVIRDDSTTDPAGAVYTYVGVKGGDQLDLALPLAPTTPITVTVQVPDPDPDARVPVAVRTPCGAGQGTPPEVTLTLDGSCGAMTDFYVTELDAEPSAFIKRAAITPTIDLSTEMYRPALATSLSVSNAPIGATISIEKTLETDLFRPVFSTGPLAVISGQSVDSEVPDLPGVEEQLIATVAYQGSTQRVGTRELYAAAPGTVDLSTAMIVGPSAPTLVNDTLAWTESGSGAPDLVVGDRSGAGIHHTIVGPYSGASLRIPRLPALFAAFNGQPDDVVTVALAKATGGYDAVRKSVFAGPLAPLGGSATLSLADPALKP